MRLFLIVIFSLLLFFSCSKKPQAVAPPSTKTEALKVYQEALEELKNGQFLIASRKFDQSESLLPQTEWAAKSALMSSYCLYSMNYFDEAVLNETLGKLYKQITVVTAEVENITGYTDGC